MLSVEFVHLCVQSCKFGISAINSVRYADQNTLLRNQPVKRGNSVHIVLGGVFYAFLSRDDNNPAWTGQTFTTHTTLNTEQNQLAIKVSADN